jgi:hypothetical protein
MRHEAIWLVQLLASVALLGAAFAVGLWVGWRRWGRPGPASWDTLHAEVEIPRRGTRHDLFAPEVDLRDEVVRGELTAGS